MRLNLSSRSTVVVVPELRSGISSEVTIVMTREVSTAGEKADIEDADDGVTGVGCFSTQGGERGAIGKCELFIS